MKIAVFGDSYAADADTAYDPWPGWVERLRTLDSDLTVDNYARAGSSFWYSWSQFRQHYNQYDRVIVFVTHWDRQSFYTGAGADLYPYCHMPGIRNVQAAIQTFPRHVRPALRALEQYWLLVDQDQQRRELHDLMLANIQQLAPRALIVPCFNWEGSRLASPSQTTLHDISNRDIPPELSHDAEQFYQQYACQRTNHMTPQNLDQMAQCMLAWIQTGLLTWDQVAWLPNTQYQFEDLFKKL